MVKQIEITDRLVGVFVGAILAAAMIPIALQQLAGASFLNLTPTGFVPASQVALFGVISIAVIVVVVLVFFKLI